MLKRRRKGETVAVVVAVSSSPGIRVWREERRESLLILVWYGDDVGAVVTTGPERERERRKIQTYESLCPCRRPDCKALFSAVL